jgi:hypothetical protein
MDIRSLPLLGISLIFLHSCNPGDLQGREKVVASCTINNQSDYPAVAYVSVDSSSAADNCDPDSSGISDRLQVLPGEAGSIQVSMRCSYEPDASIEASLIDAPATNIGFHKKKNGGSASASIVCTNDGCTEI